MTTIGIADNTRGQLIMKAQIDIVDHSYIMALELLKLEKPDRKKKRKTRVVKTYDSYLRADQGVRNSREQHKVQDAG